MRTPLSDEVLTEAWNRFLHHHHQYGRRYGSNIPGPLEAHRRLARRRMGMSAVGAGVQGGAPDFGALFGQGVFDPQRLLNWKPPGMEKVKKEEHWMVPKTSAKRKEDVWDSVLELERVAAVEASRAALEELLDTKGMASVNKVDMDDVLAFLESTRDEPDANNLRRACEWLAERRPSRHAYQALADLVASKVRLQTLLEKDLPEILVAMAAMEKRSSVRISRILDEVPTCQLSAICAATTRTLFRNSPSNGKPSREMLLWLHCLCKCHSLRDHLPNHAFNGVHEVLASCFRDPGVLADHLSAFSEKVLCEILLRHWVPRLAVNGPTTTFLGNEIRLNYASSMLEGTKGEKLDLEAVRADFEVMRMARLPTRRGTLRNWTCVPAFLCALQKNGLPHDTLATSIFTILPHNRHIGAPTLFYIFRELQRHPALGVPAKLSHALVRHFLECGSDAGLAYASRVFRSSKTIPLKDFPDLALRLARSEKVDARAIWNVLHRQTAEEIVPLPERTHKNNSLLPEHIDLIHLVAITIARSRHVRPRVAYRRVWECYRFLKDKGCPVGGLMTRALVIAGIMRYLQQFRKPIRVQYLLDMVREVEGEEVALKLDQAILKLWQNILPIVKHKWRERVSKARHEIQQVLEKFPKGRLRYNNSLWMRRKHRKYKDVTTTKDQRIAAAQQTWLTLRVKTTDSALSTYSPLVSAMPRPCASQDEDAAVPSVADSHRSKTALENPSDQLIAIDDPKTKAKSSSTSITIIQRNGLGYNNNNDVPLPSPTLTPPTEADHDAHLHAQDMQQFAPPRPDQADPRKEISIAATGQVRLLWFEKRGGSRLVDLEMARQRIVSLKKRAAGERRDLTEEETSRVRLFRRAERLQARVR